nr:uncharacterized protein LOC113815618 [Penaeus vannamei]
MDVKKKSTASGSGKQRASGSGRGEEEQQPAGGTEPKDQEATETTSESRPREPPEEGPGGGRAAEAAATPTPLLSPREEQQLILTVYAEALSGHLTTTIDKATKFLRGLGIRSRQSATEERSPEDFADAFGGKEGVLERLLEAVQMLNALDRSRRSSHNVFDKIRSNLAELCYAVSSSDEDSDEDASEGGVLEQERQPEEKMKALLEERGEVVVETWWERLRKQLKEELDVFRPVLKKAHWELVEVFCEKSTASRSGKQRASGSGRGEEEQQPAGGADPKDQETTETTSESRPREPPEEGPDGDREAEEVIATLTSKLSPWGKLHLVLVVNLRILEQLLHLVVSKATEFLSSSEVSRLLYSQEEEDDPAGPGAREASSAAGSYYEEMGVVEELLQVVEMLNCMDKPRTQTSIILDKILSCVSNLDLVCHFLFLGSDEDVSKAESVKQESQSP